MKKVITSIVITTFLSACMQTKPNPIPLSQTGDDTKSCQIILHEMQEAKKIKEKSHSDRNSQIGLNAFLGVSGIFLLVPWFFIDTSNAHTVDMNAADGRFNRLYAMAIEKKCSNVMDFYKDKN
ncbi:hypothetical protein [Frederiksenia canicola]|uniref:Lipoprotein n=2 Tax=Frederiksenia canicola TaxID=123824 RepID=A0ABX9XQP6_9PAST|nr:hypothetical protein [Frederiksenia canicola]RPE93809.1 hypothetical protein EDC49_1323 [Frederiksenia canicola]